MMSDLRGFTSLAERLAPEQVVQILNTCFEVMVEVLIRYNATINEIIGDALLVIFGAPQLRTVTVNFSGNRGVLWPSYRVLIFRLRLLLQCWFYGRQQA